jgi:glycosyltransferase involved in cell wall biosynthesis
MPGIGRYIRCLAEGISRSVPDVKLTSYCLTTQESLAEEFESFGAVRTVAFKAASLKEQFLWPFELKRGDADVFHAPHFVFPLASPVPLVVSIHDLVYFRYPPAGATGLVLRTYYGIMHRFALLRASAIVTGSEFARREIRSLLGSRRAVNVVADAVQGKIGTPSENEIGRVRQAYSLPDKFVLYLGTNKPWKNVSTIIEAARHLRKSRAGIIFVMAGKPARNEASLIDQVNDSGLGDVVRVIGEVKEEDLPGLYGAARVLVCPSTYEGFGLTPLEAMACGTAVIASTAASLPEVVGNAGMMVDPLDIPGWCSAIQAVWLDDTLVSNLRERGLAHAAAFTPDAMAVETAKIYRRVAAASR